MIQEENRKRYMILDGSVLKTIAVVTMLIDHTAVVLLSNSNTVVFSFAGHVLTLYTLMRFIGRISFPIYAFLLAEGYVHTRDVKQYALNLLLFAVISEMPWNLEHTGTFRYANQNVFFTLLLGLLGIWAIDKLRNEPLKLTASLVCLLILSNVIKCDYGIRGFGFILMMYLLREEPFGRAAVGCCILNSTWKASLAFIPIALYNGKRGFIKNEFLKFLFYAVYPIHMMILYWIKLKTIGF